MKSKYLKKLNKQKKRKNEPWSDCPLTDHRRSTQIEYSKWTFMAKNKRKKIRRPLKEDLYIGNLTNGTTEENILPPAPKIRRYYIFTWEQFGKKVVYTL